VRLRELRRLSEISLNVWLFLAQLVPFTLAARLAVKLAALPRLVGFMARCAGNHRLRRFPINYGCYEVAQLALLADIAARLMPDHRHCLARSLLLFRLLKARGAPVALLIVISKAAASLHGHACIPLRQRVIGGHPQLLRRFAFLLRF
jgi:hypothetical protein